MSDKPETLDAILAEMRADRCIPHHIDWADRIEAAAKRERAITDIMLAVKDKPLTHPDPEHAPPLFFPMTKTQLQTLSDLVAIAHDEMDGLPHHEQELERFDSLLFDVKARYAFGKPYAAPGNAAALREALENAISVFRDDLPTPRDISRAFATANAALAAPARNCDRFKTLDEAREAFQDLRGHKILADVELWDSMDEAGALVRWLFAKAEGGAE